MIDKQQIKFITLFYPKLIEEFKCNEDEQVLKQQILYYSTFKTFNPPDIIGTIDEERVRITDSIGNQLKNMGLLQACIKFIK